MNIDFNVIWNGLVTNGFYDIIKIIFGGLLGWLGCKYKNNLKIKGNKNKVYQKSGKNNSQINGDSNDITQI